MLETMVAFNLVEHVGDSVFDPQEGPVGYERLLTRNRKPHRTADGHICVLPYSSQNWRDFFQICGRAELANDPRFKDLPARTKHIGLLYGLLEEALLEKTTAEWESLCASRQIPCMRLTDVGELHQDPHLKAVHFFRHADHPSQGMYRQVDSPVRFSQSPASVRRHAPVIGEHSIEILEQSGFSRTEIEQLLLSGATIDGRSPRDEVSAKVAEKLQQ
jgi:crotonobetainyl-CoA:carnitine CoA-transferase CaiB-like acyl-CoA transferase